MFSARKVKNILKANNKIPIKLHNRDPKMTLVWFFYGVQGTQSAY